jgi:hypothetical protein
VAGKIQDREKIWRRNPVQSLAAVADGLDGTPREALDDIVDELIRAVEEADRRHLVLTTGRVVRLECAAVRCGEVGEEILEGEKANSCGEGASASCLVV